MFKRSRIAMLLAGALFAAQAGAHPGYSETMSSDSFSPPDQITVFNPDGSSYSIVPIEMDVATLEPFLLISAQEPLPEQVTVFEPNGLVYSYALTPVEPAVMWEPTDFVVMENDVSIDPVALSDDDALSRPVYVAHFVSPPLIEPVSMWEPIDIVSMEDDFSIDPVALSDDDALSQPVYVAHFVSPPTYTGILEEEAIS